MDDTSTQINIFHKESGDEFIFELPADLYVTTGFLHREGTFRSDDINFGSDSYSFPEACFWSADITNTGDALLVTGSVCATAHGTCARCLEDTQVSIEGDLEGYFIIGDTDAPEGLDADEFDYLPKTGILNLAPLMLAAIVVEFPLVPLCSETCKGLCPQCGANLNQGACACKDKEGEDDFAQVKNPFAPLKNLEFT